MKSLGKNSINLSFGQIRTSQNRIGNTGVHCSLIERRFEIAKRLEISDYCRVVCQCESGFSEAPRIWQRRTGTGGLGVKPPAARGQGGVASGSWWFHPKISCENRENPKTSCENRKNTIISAHFLSKKDMQ